MADSLSLPVYSFQLPVACVAMPADETQALAQRACFDCHGNETVWPWYSRVAPSRWLLAMDVAEGRDHMNFSDWGSRSQSADEIAREIERGSMPPGRHLALHPEARLSDAEIARLIEGFRRSAQ
jgi:hypothetical protein